MRRSRMNSPAISMATVRVSASASGMVGKLNPQASAKLANRLLEAHERDYWSPDEATLAALREAGDEFEDRIEGIANGVAA